MIRVSVPLWTATGGLPGLRTPLMLSPAGDLKYSSTVLNLGLVLLIGIAYNLIWHLNVILRGEMNNFLPK